MLSRFETFSSSISEIDRYWHKIAADEMEAYGLKGPYAVYLLSLDKYPNGITAAKLSEICDRNKADVSRAINDLEKKGIIKKEGSSYRALIILTEEGKKAAEHVKIRAAKAVESGGKGLSDEQRTALYEALELIANNLKEIAKKGL